MLLKWAHFSPLGLADLCPVFKTFSSCAWVVERVPSSNHGALKTIGAYLLIHPATKKAYVGSHANLYSRPYQHHSLLSRGVHWNKKLQEAFNVDPNFVVAFVVTVDREKAYDVEQTVLNRHLCEDVLFNAASDSRLSTLGLEVSTETRQKLSAVGRGRPQTSEHVQKRTAWMNGRSLSLDTIEKIRVKAKARGISPEMKLKAALVNSKAVYVDGVVFPSKLTAGNAYQRGLNSVTKRIKSKSFPGWHLASDIFERPIMARGVRYESIEKCSLATGLNVNIIKLRVDDVNNGVYASWHYCDAYQMGSSPSL